MENLRKSTKNRVLFVLCTLMLAVICIAPFGLKPQNAYAACSHNWRDEKVMSQPTCTVNGSKMQYCTKCRSRRTVSISKLGHRTNGSYTIAQYATCGKAGRRVLKCTRCYAVLNSQTIPATGNHNWRESKVFQRPTCTTNGSIQQQCSGCGQTRMTYPSKFGHQSNGSYSVTKQATCTENGRRVLKCTRSGCNAVLNAQDIPALGHNSAKRTNAIGLKEEYCTRCNTILDAGARQLRNKLKNEGYSDTDINNYIQQALSYMNKTANIKVSDSDSTVMMLVGKVAESGYLTMGNEKLENFVSACEYISFVNDLRKTFNADTGNVERFESTLDSLSFVCGKVPGGEQTICKLLDGMNEYAPKVLEEVERTLSVRDLRALTSYRSDEGPTVVINNVKRNINDLSVYDIAANYDAVANSLKNIYYSAYDKTASEKNANAFVANYVKAKIGQHEACCNDFKEYLESIK